MRQANLPGDRIHDIRWSYGRLLVPIRIDGAWEWLGWFNRRLRVTNRRSFHNCTKTGVSALFLLLLLTGCPTLSGLNPFGGGTGGPAQAFGVAKAAYIAAFDSAARYVAMCQAQPPTLRCDELGELIFDEVNPMARQHIGLGEGILAGLVTEQMACDEVTKPGCTEQNRLKQLETLAIALQQAAVMLNSRR